MATMATAHLRPHPAVLLRFRLGCRGTHHQGTWRAIEVGIFNPNDLVAVSFWNLSREVTATCFPDEVRTGEFHWKTSMNVDDLVTLVAAVHYFTCACSGSESVVCHRLLLYRLVDHRALADA